MNFDFSGKNLVGRERRLQRLFEILPGLTSWTILIGLTALSFTRPMAAAVFIIAFDLYWLLRILYSTIFMVLASFRLSADKRRDWMGLAREVSGGPAARRAPGLRSRLSHAVHDKAVRRLAASGSPPPPADSIVHLVIVPVAKERREVFEPGVKSFADQQFPSKRIVVVIAVEERAPEACRRDVEAVRDENRDGFMEFLVVPHPSGVPGEARVKGANATHAAREAARWLAARGIDPGSVVVSCFDADTVVGPEYFACLTYHYLVTPERERASFQPVPVYNNNLWDVPGFARILEMGSSFFLLMEGTNPEKLVTFSSHSMSFKALIEVGYWPVDMISDDSAIFWKAYLHYDGRYRVVPLFVTLSMDVAASDTWWKTVKNVYKQKRRWAWGVENFPIVMRGFLKNRKIPLYDKLRHGFKLFEGHVAWATWAFILTFIGWLPGLFAGQEFSSTVLFYSVPRITQIIFNLASLSLLTTIVLSLYLLPDKPMRYPYLKRAVFALEWLLVPIIVTFLSALPALDTQTRLMRGKGMEFWVTEKSKRKP